MAKLRIAILRGGPSYQYDTSIQTGASLLRHMPDAYQAHDIFIDKNGIWHRDGAPRYPERALSGIDAVFNGLHGNFGEDGKVQKILDTFGIPYTGSDALTSAVGMNKILTKKVLQEQGIKTPYFTTVKDTDDLKEKYDHIYHHFYLPFVVKPASGGGSKGMTVVKDFRHLIDALKNAFSYSDTALIEEFVRGKEASVGVIDQFRDQQHYVLFPVEHVDGVHRVPGNFSVAEKAILQDAAQRIHKSLGLRHYSQADFIITPRRGIYLLEVNSQPPLHADAPIPKSLEAVGSNLPEFIHHILKITRG